MLRHHRKCILNRQSMPIEELMQHPMYRCPYLKRNAAKQAMKLNLHAESVGRSNRIYCLQRGETDFKSFTIRQENPTTANATTAVRIPPA